MFYFRNHHHSSAQLVENFPSHQITPSLDKVPANSPNNKNPSEERSRDQGLPTFDNQGINTPSVEIDSAFIPTGTRVVDIEFLIQQLQKGCLYCSTRLHITNVTSERRQGLASSFYVLCELCELTTAIHTSRSHLSNPLTTRSLVYDVNTKAALGVTHSGAGLTQINNFLAQLNIPPIHHGVIDRRSKEVGVSIEEEAQKSCVEAIEDERQAKLEQLNETDVGQDVQLADPSYDAGWTKPRGFNSNTGVGTLCGGITRKCIAFECMNKKCRVHALYEKHKKTVPPHNCRMNYQGSSKGMEPAGAIRIFKKILLGKNKITGLVGDDDATTIAHLREEVDSEIRKVSDHNHTKKSLRKHIDSLGLSIKPSQPMVKVRNHFVKCFTYAVYQSKGDSILLSKTLKAITPHTFGNHLKCDIGWCKFLQKIPPCPDGMLPYKHSGLKDGKDLDKTLNPTLYEALSDIFENLANISEKLAPLGSSQCNESLNSTITSKTTKRLFFGSSASNDYRVAAAVCQKNSGYGYVVDVMKRLGLPVGDFTKFYATTMQKKLVNDIARKKSLKYKIARAQHQRERCNANKSSEILEGTTYESGVELSTNVIDVTNIPEHTVRPVMKPLEKFPSDDALVIFDLETATSGIHVELTQLSAVALKHTDSFNRYILPEGQISKIITNVTGISVRRKSGIRTLFHKDTQVPSVDSETAISDFIAFLRGRNCATVLVAHNCKAFDSRHLIHAVQNANLLDNFKEVVIGFCDTLPYFRSKSDNATKKKSNDSRGGNDLSTLYRTVFKEEFEAHNAVADVRAVKRLLNESTSKTDLLKYCNSLEDYISDTYWLDSRHENLKTLQILLQQPNAIISKGIAEKIAGSGLKYNHLKLAFSRDEEEGIKSLLSSKISGQLRVTNTKRIIDKLTDYFKKNK